MTEAKEGDLTRAKHPGAREIYRDDVLWVLDKPGGVLSHPNPPSKSAQNALFRGTYDFERELYRIECGPEGKKKEVYLVHRLDQETSGLIICAFNSESAAKLKEALFHRELEKEYRALVLGVPRQPKGEWADRLEKVSRGGQAKVSVGRGKPNAVTRYAVLEAFGRQRAALLSLWPETGRTHQLRVQASTRGHPIAGDDRYGDFEANRWLAAEIGLKRMFLHAFRVELRHPRTGHVLKLHAPFTSRLAGPLEKLAQVSVRIPRARGR